MFLQTEHKSLGLFDELCINFERTLSQEEFTTVAKRYRELQEELLEEYVKPFDGVLSVLSKLREQGVKVVILTNRPFNSLKAFLRALKIESYFDVYPLA